jgi:hypothetical protein
VFGPVANQFVDDLDHVQREADGARLIGQRSPNCLTDPPGSVGGKFVTPAVLELVYRLHQADVSLLDEIEEMEPAVAVLLSDGNREAQVGFDELVLCPLRIHLALDDFALRALEFPRTSCPHRFPSLSCRIDFVAACYPSSS